MTLQVEDICIMFLQPFCQSIHFVGFPDGPDSKESACSVGDLSSVPELGRSPGERKGNPFQYSCLENSMDRGAWKIKVHGLQRVTHDWATTTFTFTFNATNYKVVFTSAILLYLSISFISLFLYYYNIAFFCVKHIHFGVSYLFPYLFFEQYFWAIFLVVSLVMTISTLT